MERLILARHGESEYSARGLVNGDAEVDVGLTEIGVAQARRLGIELLGEEIDLCITSALARTQATAEIALDGRAVPLEAWWELNDPAAGSFVGKHLDEYRAWAWSTGSRELPPGGGESRFDCVVRFVGAYRRLLQRPEATVLAVAHALPIAYLMHVPAARMDLPIEYAVPYRFDAHDLERALGVLEAWVEEPDW